MHLEADTIEKILIELGYKLQDCGQYWRSNAVYRDGDNRTSLLIWKNSGAWKDFAANTKYFHFNKLVELSSQDDPKRAAELISSIKNNAEIYFDTPPAAPSLESPEFFDHDEVKTLLPHYDFYNKKGISDNILRLTKGGFAMSGKMSGRFVFPIFSEHGKVIGLSGRDLFQNNESTRPKWKHLGKKSGWIYPYYLPTDSKSPFVGALEANREVILIEGISDSLALSQQGLYGHLALFGLVPSSKLISFLISKNIKKIVIATNNDSDKEINRGLNAAINIFIKLMNFFNVEQLEIRLPVKYKDFGEMLENGVPIEEWIDKKINKIKQIDYILALDKQIVEITPKQRRILESYRQGLKG